MRWDRSGDKLTTDSVAARPSAAHAHGQSAPHCAGAEFVIAKQNQRTLRGPHMDFLNKIGEIHKRTYFGLCNAVMAAAPGEEGPVGLGAPGGGSRNGL